MPLATQEQCKIHILRADDLTIEPHSNILAFKDALLNVVRDNRSLPHKLPTVDTVHKEVARKQYQAFVDAVNARPDCEAYSTNKREAENYLHHDAINLALVEAGVTVTLTAPFNEFDDVPTLLATQVNAVTPPSNKWNDKRAKDFLCNNAAVKMTRPMLDDIDPCGEVRQWFQRMHTLLAVVQ